MKNFLRDVLIAHLFSYTGMILLMGMLSVVKMTNILVRYSDRYPESSQLLFGAEGVSILLVAVFLIQGALNRPRKVNTQHY
jgi:hypothetical protein